MAKSTGNHCGGRVLEADDSGLMVLMPATPLHIRVGTIMRCTVGI